MDESFQFLMSEYGLFTDSAPLPAASAAAMRNDFPEEFVSFLEEAGLGVWQSGRFQFCDPLSMAGVVEPIFDGDKDFHPDKTFIYGYGAVGLAFVWNSVWNEHILINLPDLEASSLVSRNKKSKAKITIVSSILYLENDYYDLIDPKNGNHVLAKFLRKNGALKSGEVYGYFPALALGGSGALDTLKKVQAVEHFTILAQLGPVQLRHIKKGGIRSIGKA